jgi:heme/copper-type cytochrome/quinol oxidase subunit 3
MIELSIVGLSIVFISWIIQFFRMNKRREISTGFIITYIIGVLFLVFDAYNSKKIDLAIINTLAAIAAVCVLIKFSKPNL